MKKLIYALCVSLLLGSALPAFSLAEEAHTAEQERMEQQSSFSPARAHVEAIEEKMMGTEGHKIFEIVVDPLMTNPVAATGILVVGVAALGFGSWWYFLRRKKR